MSFIRPEARAALWRWREVCFASVVAAVGLWWILAYEGLLPWIGVAVTLAAAALGVAGIQRGRFRGASGGPGIVHIDEGQIAYFGPLTGGVIALSEISSLSYDPSGKPAHWILSQAGQEDVFIPRNAEGADQLFDVFSSLPGLRTEQVLAALRQAEGGPVVLWRRSLPDTLIAR